MTTIQIAVRAIFALAVIVLLYNTITVDFNDEAFRGVRQKLRGSSVEQGDAKPTASENSTIQNNTQTVTHSVNATETVHVVDKAVDPKIMVSAVPDYLNEENNEGLRPVPPVQRPIDYQAKLNDDQRKMLSGLLANETDQRLQNIRSLYGMNGPRTWLEHFDSMPDELLFPMTKFAQKAIYEHQHPASCEGKSFVRIPIRISNGIGAAAHYAGEALGYALWDDRIAVLDLANPPLQKHIEVIDGNKNPFGRIFEEITSCQAYATEQNTKNLWDYEDPGAHRPTLPILGQAMLDQFPDITPNAMAVWARAQHVAYLLRLRPEALAYLAANRVNKDVQVGYTNLEQVPMPFPLPQKSWSMHVRHGDKGGEMRLVPFREFILTAEKYAMQNPIESRKWAFVSSDDPEVFEVMKKTVSIKDTDTVSNKQWHWFMSNMVRSTEVQFATLEGQANKTVTTLDWLSQLFLALECEAFVGTRGSNWNALIEELRGTWAPAARGPYLDVSREHDWMNYPA